LLAIFYRTIIIRANHLSILKISHNNLFLKELFVMMRLVIGGIVAVLFVTLAGNIKAQNIYDLHKLTEQQWLSMPTEQRLNALGLAVKQADNQTFVGQFGRYQDLYKKWGYDFYEMNDQYENYAFRGYENYNVINERRVRWSYNEFGDRIAKMRVGVSPAIYLWREVNNDDGTFSITQPSSYINSVSSYNVDGVWVAKEATNDWAMSVIAAGSLRTKYSPLTLNIPNLTGTRIDVQSANNTLSLVSSIPLGYSINTWDPNLYGQELNTVGGVLLRGGRFQRKIGALTLGTTYVNEYAAQSNRQGGGTWYGTVSNYTPTPMIVAVRVLDDSPDDGIGGPIVSDVRIKVNGRYRDDIKAQAILDDVTRDRTTAVTNEFNAAYITPPSGTQIGGGHKDHIFVDFLSIGSTLPKFMDYFFLNDSATGVNRENSEKNYDQLLARKYYQQVDPLIPVQVNGTQYIVYLFDITSIKEQVQEVTAELTVCNDYLVQTGEILTTNKTPGKDPGADYLKSWNATYWRTALEAEGNIKDKSNLQRVTVDFGVQVASIIYGVDANFNYMGLKINAEYATNSSHYMFPDDVPGVGYPKNATPGLPPRQGHRWAQMDHAYYVTAQKDWKMFGFAGEVFKMGNFFKPYIDYYQSVVLQTWSNVNNRNGTVRIPLIEDNDDNDQYPDTNFDAMKSMGYNILALEDPDGVFPGNDQDHDGIPDNEKNQNGVPDYTEPFLMLDSDPDEFQFGNDYDNNNIPDFREDDMKLDTPYDLDRQGHHYYIRLTPVKNINFILGTMRTKGVGTDNRTNDDYAKFQLNYDVFGIGKLYAEYRREHIQDNIRDPYIQMQTKGERLGFQSFTFGWFSRDLFYDELEYKNSNVDRIWIDSAIRAIPSLTIENHLKLERNNQIEGLLYDNTYQPKLGIHTAAMVNKVFYTKSFGNWIFSPGIKFRFYKKDRDQAVRFGEYYLTRIPIVMLKYVFTPRTDLTLGMQGVPGFEYSTKDYMQSENNFKEKIYSIELQNRTVYFGYNIWAAMGIRFDQLKFDENLRAFENLKTSTFFLQVNLGISG
jgi:hypothetical protein